MADGDHIEHGQIAITQPRIVRCCWNLTYKRMTGVGKNSRLVEACCQRALWQTTGLDDRVIHARTPYQLIWHTLVTDIYNYCRVDTYRLIKGQWESQQRSSINSTVPYRPWWPAELPPVSHGPIWWVMRLLWACGSMWSQLYWLCV